MAAASALGWKACPCCFSQYCMIIETVAAPQPSFGCFTKGTSSQIADGAPADSRPQTPIQRTATLNARYNMQSAYGNDDQDQYRDRNEDDDQVSIAKRSSSKVGLGFLRARSQLGQLGVIQRRNCFLDLLRVEVGRAQRLPGLVGRNEVANRFKILLANPACLNGGSLQLRWTRNVQAGLGKKVARDREQPGQDQSDPNPA